MPDREKVRTQLAGIGIGLDMAGYHNDAQCVRDALALLRELEPVRPEHIRSTIRSFGSDGFRDECSVDSYKCGNCHKAIEDTHSFCPWCGRAVKWRA